MQAQAATSSRTTTYVGNYFEWRGTTANMVRYYYAGSQRVALRTGAGNGTNGLQWLLGDHLGSTAITANGATGAKLSELRYKPWGELRYAWNPTAGDYRYTGQRQTGTGLMDYGARMYDPALGRFIQADSIIPDPYNPQDWDRYSYVRNNPVRYIDPSGHMADDGCSTLGCDMNDLERQDMIATRIFKGSGEDGKWTAEDYDDYYIHKKYNKSKIWENPSMWKNKDSQVGWDLFEEHVRRLASYYSPDQLDQFIRDFGLVFGGISAQGDWTDAARGAAGGPPHEVINYSNEGLPQQYLDSEYPAANQSHHYAGILFLSYFGGGGVAGLVNLGRDITNPGDIRLGNVAAYHGMRMIRGTIWGDASPQALPRLIASLIS